ncbi:ATP-binding protein [Kitasatospora sp. NPDC059571]|uniref:ATP-binding protein n=1 Tax=Kitasatospora sp. NPDC059571 TaxID=3346871 RepID=UPI00367CDEAE
MSPTRRRSDQSSEVLGWPDGAPGHPFSGHPPCRFPADHDSWRLAQCPKSVGRARQASAGRLASWNVDRNAADAVLLVVSELVTNAVVHAAPPIALHLFHDRSRRQICVAVTDGGPAVRSDGSTTARSADECGRGLEIVRSVASAHGMRVRPDGAARWVHLPVRRVGSPADSADRESLPASLEGVCRRGHGFAASHPQAQRPTPLTQ